MYWKDACWSWNSSILATWYEELTHWKKPWCWERFKAGGEEDYRGWDGWMASSTRWTWVWVISGNWWWTGRPGVLQSMKSQRVRHDWVTELNWCQDSAKLWSSNLQTNHIPTPVRLGDVVVAQREIWIMSSDKWKWDVNKKDNRDK